MSKASFHILYDGPALANHEMDVKDLAPALLALGELLEEANNAFNDGHAKIALQVKASFKTGCFGIELEVIQSLIQQAQMFFNSDGVVTAKELLEWLGLLAGGTTAIAVPVKGLISLIKRIRGRQIRKVVLLDDGRTRIVLDDESFEVERQVIELYQRLRLRKSLESVLQPLEREGIEEFAVVDQEQKRLTTVTKSERRYFVAPAAEQELLEENEVVMSLQLLNVAFKDDNKWRFSDGTSAFYATLQDAAFLNAVNKGEENFASGDILKARLLRRQWLAGDNMKTEYDLLEVLEHRRGGAQLKLPFTQE